MATGAVISPRRPVGAAVPRTVTGAALGTPPAAEIVERGPQGPPGAAFSGFGYVQYAALASAPPLMLTPGVRTPLTMVIDPAQTTDTLKGPFTGFGFWDGTLLHARAAGDLYEVRVTLTATADIAGGTLATDVTILGLSVATDIDSKSLFYPAGQGQRVGFKLRLLPKAGFVNGAAQIYLTSTVPVSITSEVLAIDPTNAGP